MPSSTFQPVDSLGNDMANKVHNLASDTLKVALTTNANTPVVGDGQLSDLTTVSLTNLSSDTITTTSNTQTGGVGKLILVDKVLTASGGSVGPFQQIVIYNDTATNDELLGWLDYGSEITLADTETLTIDFSATNGILQTTHTP